MQLVHRISLVLALLGLTWWPLVAHSANPERVESAQQAAPDGELDLEEPTTFFEPGSLRDKFTHRATFDQYVTYALRSVSLVAGFDNDLHRYDNQLDLINSFERNLTYGDDLSSLRAHIDSSETELLQNASELTLLENERNQEECASQLDFIFEELLKLYRDYDSFTQSKRLDLIDFIDSYGSAPGDQLMMASSFWLGSYDQCQQARIEHTEARLDSATGLPVARPDIRGRYCVAQLRLPSWDRAKREAKISVGSESIKLGVCLPRACNSISILRHQARIGALIRLARLQQVPYSSLKLSRLYCLPDENSPLRQFSLSARLFIAFVSIWLLLVLYASFKYERARARRRSLGQDPNLAAQESMLVRTFALPYACQQLFSPPASAPTMVASPKKTTTLASTKLSESKEALKFNLKQENLLFAMTIRNSREAMPAIALKPAAVLADQTTGDSDQQAKPAQTEGGASQNLAVIDGIKVVSMIWLISAHTLLFFIRNIANGRQFWSILLDARFMAIMAGIFPVDSFFTVTGVLTSYLKFIKPSTSGSGSSRSPMLTVGYWLEMFIHRYLRFMPMYLLVFWYTRDISEFIGHGPMWDYATASTSLRSICKRESLLVPLLFQANFKPLEQHCVKPAWYLANDYQYLLITPLFIVLLIASRWLGYLAIGLAAVASLVAQFLTVYQQEATWWWWGPLVGSTTGANTAEVFTDFGALINFKPMFATYVLKDLWRLYVLPHNRIPPYLIGLLTGHLMYCYAKRPRAAKKEPDCSEKAQQVDLAAASTESLVSSSSSCSTTTTTPTTTSTKKPAGHATAELVKTTTKKTPGLIDLDIWVPVALLVAVVYLPLASRVLEEQRGEQARIGASLIIALMRFVWSLAVARLIYVCFKISQQPLAASGRSFLVCLLSSAAWRPWSKICLSVLLIQWEIISYLAQVQPVQNLTFSLLLAFVIISIIASYAIGLLIYLLFEFPLSQLEQLYISPKLFASHAKQSR